MIRRFNQVSLRLRLDEALDEYGAWAERWRETELDNNKEHNNNRRARRRRT